HMLSPGAVEKEAKDGQEPAGTARLAESPASIQGSEQPLMAVLRSARSRPHGCDRPERLFVPSPTGTVESRISAPRLAFVPAVNAEPASMQPRTLEKIQGRI